MSMYHIQPAPSSQIWQLWAEYKVHDLSAKAVILPYRSESRLSALGVVCRACTHRIDDRLQRADSSQLGVPIRPATECSG